jgi:hypothetical protein
MNIIRSKDIMDQVPDWDSNGTIGASTGSRHATVWRTGRRIYAPKRREARYPQTIHRHQDEKIFCAILKPRLTRGFLGKA